MRTKQLRSRPCLGWLCLTVCLGESAYLLAQPKANPKPISTVADLVALAADPKAHNINYVQVGQVLKALSSEERTRVLRQLIGSANLEIASMAAGEQISQRDVSSTSLIAAQITRLPPGSQSRIVHNVAIHREFMEVARELVRDAIKNARKTEPENPASDAVNTAAILLAKTPVESDRKLLADLALIRPNAWGTWLAIGYAGSMDPGLASLAARAYSDGKVPLAARVAASAALGSAGSQASSFAGSQIESFLVHFADQSPFATLVRLSKNQIGQESEEARLFTDFVNGVYILPPLMTLPAALAEPLVFRFLNAQNERIRTYCGIVAALRWPEKLIQAGQGKFTDQEYADYMALIALRHPQHALATSVRVTPSRMDKAKDRISRFGPTAFSPHGGLFVAF